MKKNYGKTILTISLFAMLLFGIIGIILLFYMNNADFSSNAGENYYAANNHQAIYSAIIGCLSTVVISFSVFLANKIQMDETSEREWLSKQPLLYISFKYNDPEDKNQLVLHAKNISENTAINVIICHDYLCNIIESSWDEEIKAFYYNGGERKSGDKDLDIKIGAYGPYEVNEKGLPMYIDVLYTDQFGNHCVQIYVCEMYSTTYQYELAGKPFIRTRDRFMDHAPEMLERYEKKRNKMKSAPIHDGNYNELKNKLMPLISRKRDKEAKEMERKK